MQRKLIKYFVYSAGVLFAFTAIAKFVSSSGDARILQNPDPILGIPFRHVFWIVGALELAIALICFFNNSIGLQVGLIAWIGSSFLVYHVGLVLVSYRKPCPCLGNLTDALHIPPQIADVAMKIILAYLLIGSYATLFGLWRHRKRAISSAVGAASL